MAIFHKIWNYMLAQGSSHAIEPSHSSCEGVGEKGIHRAPQYGSRRRRTSSVYLVTVNYKFMTLWCNCCNPCSIYFSGRACWTYRGGVFYGCSVCLSCADKGAAERSPHRTKWSHFGCVVLAGAACLCQKSSRIVGVSLTDLPPPAFSGSRGWSWFLHFKRGGKLREGVGVINS